MKYFLRTGFCLLVFLTVSCSRDSSPGTEEEQVILPNFRLIGEDADNIYQYTYNASAESGTEINLTQTLGVDPFYLTLRQVAEVVSFYSFSADNFSLIQQNTLTGQSASYLNFYTVSDERSITWGTNSEDLLFLGYYSPKGSRNFGLRTLDPTDGSFTDLSLDFNIQQAYDPLYFRQRLFITYKDEAGNYKIVVYNTETRNVMITLDYGPGIPNLLIDELGNLGILVGLGNSDFVYYVLDIETLNEINEFTFSLNEFLPPGPLQGDVFDTTLFYTNYLAQPSEIPFGPAYFDFVTNENFIVDILGIVQQVELETQFTLALTALRYYNEAEVFLMGYADASSQIELRGGVLIISKSGQLLSRIELPFVPTYFVKP
ncbi:MAG: hypothetical protein HKP07_08730 [Flavobacteriaceae bacterium]|nr:hypothetical protein [Flavobacteriaceae bacterium]